MPDFTRKTVLVAGAGRGIGAGIARAFAGAGAAVWLGGRRKEPLESVAATITDAGNARPNVVVGDFSSRGCLPLIDRLPALDVLVVNYGDTDTAPGFNTDDDSWDRLMTANLTGPARLSRHVAHGMAERGHGAILFIGSICGLEVLGAPVGYNVSKAGLRSLSKTMARELGPSGVRVNLIHPGNVLFEGGRWDDKLKAKPGLEDDVIQSVPLRRFGTPQDIAEAALFLCSSDASFITGAELVVDGGQTVGV